MIEKPSVTGIECQFKDKGCPYRKTGSKPMHVHEEAFCKFGSTMNCHYCNLPTAPEKRADHMVKYHGTEFAAVVNGNKAITTISMFPACDWYMYYVHIRKLKFFFFKCIINQVRS